MNPALAKSLDKLDRLIATRRSQYKTQVNKGRMDVAVAADKDLELATLRRQVAWFFAHGDAFKAWMLAQARSAEAASAAGADADGWATADAATLAHPAVAAVTAVVPGTAISARPLTTATPDLEAAA
jgi:hypothetical protein